MGQPDCDAPQRQAAMKRERGEVYGWEQWLRSTRREWMGTRAIVSEEWWQRSKDHMRAQVAGTMNECGMSGGKLCDNDEA